MHTDTGYLMAADGTRLAIHSWLPDGVAPLGGLERRGAPAATGVGTPVPAGVVVGQPAPGAASGRGAADAGSPDTAQQTGPQAAQVQPSPAQPRAVIQVVHGIAEHAARYGRLAAAAVEAGYAVHADDHRGHGATAAPEARGHLADEDGWALVVSDLSALLDRIRDTYPGAPVILLGHSWGSFLARDLATRRGEELAGLILLGTGAGVGTLTVPGMALASAESRMRGRSRPSRLLHALAFGPYRRHFAPNRTEVDWLSRDPAEVDRYIADPRCGFVLSSGFFLDLLAGMAAVSSREHARSMPPGLPILLASGDHDPVGAMGAGVRRVATMYRHAGVREVALTLYPGARHELLNETNRGQVVADLLAWIAARL